MSGLVDVHGNELAVSELDHAVAARSNGVTVRSHNQRAALFRDGFGQEVENAISSALVQIPGGLIGQHELGLVCQRATRDPRDARVPQPDRSPMRHRLAQAPVARCLRRIVSAQD